jgi:hypothetical protein
MIATIQPTKNHLGTKQTGGAAQRMAGPDWRGKHRAAVLEQEGEVGGHRRGEREDQSRDHDKRPNAWSDPTLNRGGAIEAPQPVVRPVRSHAQILDSCF